MNRFARTLAALAAAAAIPAAAAFVDATEGSPQQPATVTTKTVTVEVQKGQDRGPAEKADGKAVENAVAKDRMEPAQKIEVKGVLSGERKAEEKVEAKADAKAEAKVVKKAVVAIKRAAAPQQNLDPWIQQMTPQLRPMVLAQLHLILTVCSPSDEQRKQFKAEGERVLKEVARDCAAMQMGQQQGNTMSDPNQLIVNALGVALKDKFTPEQWSKFEAESRARAEARKRLVVQNLVSSLDDDLVLSTDQRATIVAAMEQNYDEKWCSTLQVLMYGTQFFPNVPGKLIEPTLTPNQKTAWNKRTRNGTMAWWNFGHNGNAVLLDDDFDAAPPAVAAPAPAEVKHEH